MIGEPELVCIAAAAAGTTAPDLLSRTDMGALARVVAAAEEDAGTLEQAARLLLAIAQERPFPDGSSPAAAWLTAAFVLGEAGVRHRVSAAEVVPFVASIDERTALVDVMVTLDRIVAGNGYRLAWLCPACGREVYARERREGRMISVGVTAFELTNRCWYEHRQHDRRGRPFRSVAAETIPVRGVMPPPAVAVEEVAKRFGETVALDGVSFEVAPGEVVGLLGPNGAGKTTLVRTIATLLAADTGRVLVEGIDVAADPGAVRACIGLAGQFAALDELLTGRENLRMVAQLYGLDRAAADRRGDLLLAALGLEGAADRRVGTYSGGMRRRLDLGATLIGSPHVLLLDEPTTGLDPRARNDVWTLVQDVARSGTAVLLTSQNLEEVDRLADRVVVLDRGVVVGAGAPGDLKHQVGGRDLDDVFLALTAEPEPDDAGDSEPIAAIPSLDPVEPRRSPGRDVAVLTRRDVTRLLRTPQLLFFSTVQPILFILGLDAVFSGLYETSQGGDYLQFLVPGVLVMNMMLLAGTTGAGLAQDMTAGIIDRFRSLPMSSVAVLAGRTTTDLGRNAAAIVLMLAAAFVLGFRIDTLGGAAAGLGLALLFGYAVTWVFAAIGLALKDPQAAQFAGFAPVLPLVYLSSAWVPVETMAPAVQPWAEHQPVTITVDAVRSLFGGEADGGAIAQSLVWSFGLLVVFVVVATRQYRRTAG